MSPIDSIDDQVYLKTLYLDDGSPDWTTSTPYTHSKMFLHNKENLFIYRRQSQSRAQKISFLIAINFLLGENSFWTFFIRKKEKNKKKIMFVTNAEKNSQNMKT